MNKSTSKLLSTSERDLIRETEGKRLSKLDTDELVELHTRVRRARNKYLKLHRRQATAQVGSDRARGVAATKNQRTSEKAEVFEEALSTVSAQLATATKKSAAKLKKDRLKAAGPSPKKGVAANRAARRKSRPTTRDSSRTRNSSKRKGDQALKSPARKKAAASSRASNKRRQAKKNSR